MYRKWMIIAGTILLMMVGDVYAETLLNVSARAGGKFGTWDGKRNEEALAMVEWLSTRMLETTYFDITLTDFEQDGDSAVIAGAAETQCGTYPIMETKIVKENDQWKFYGNQE